MKRSEHPRNFWRKTLVIKDQRRRILETFRVRCQRCDDYAFEQKVAKELVKFHRYGSILRVLGLEGSKINMFDAQLPHLTPKVDLAKHSHGVSLGAVGDQILLRL